MQEMNSAENSGEEYAAEVPAEALETDAADEGVRKEKENGMSKKNALSTKAFSDSLNRMSEKRIKRALEEERAKYEGYDELIEPLRRMGLGEDASSIARRLNEKDFAEALKEGVSAELIEKNPAVSEARRIIEEATFERDLKAVKAAYPECAAENVEELGELFLKLMAGGNVDAVSAYAAQLKYDEMTTKKPPASTGSLKSADAYSEKTFYTPEEAKRIPRGFLKNNPTLMERVRRSMAKW